VATDVLGVSGRAMLHAIVAGEHDPPKASHLARKGLRTKLPQLQMALQGRIRDHHRFLLVNFSRN
jgi:transposase